MKSDLDKQTAFRLFCMNMYYEYVAECEFYLQKPKTMSKYFNTNKYYLKQKYKLRVEKLKNECILHR